MRRIPFFSAVLVAASAGVFAGGADLSNIDRSIAKEPAYETKTPKYCLLVLGPEAKSRVWLVRDGNVLYVDRNGNGDLTEKGERVPQTRFGHFVPGEIVEADGKTKHVITSYDPPDHPGGNPQMYVDLAKKLTQRIFCPDFAASPKDAPLIHLNGPINMRSRRSPREVVSEATPMKRHVLANEGLVPGKAAWFSTLHLGTPGLGERTFAYYRPSQVLPKTNDDAQLTVQVEFPSREANGKPLIAQGAFKPDT